ncbi:MAG: exo-alpha-sialidase, partial [Thermoplasmata archaeon]|nr:exo-alpha-sialidase [Thermoplasmata archaeon]
MRASGLGLEKAENVAVRATRAIILAVAILSLVPTLSVISDSHVPSFGRNVMVNLPNQYDQGVPELAVSLDGVIYVVWVEYRNDDDDIIFAKSVDGGVSFCCYRRVNDDTLNASQTYASVAVGIDGSIHVSWRDYRNDLDRKFVPGGGIDGVNDADVYYAKSEDGGATFLPNVKVNDDAGHFQTTHMHRFIAVDDSGKIHVAWGDDRNGKTDVYYANSTDSGLTFNTNVKVSDGNGSASEASLAIDGLDNVYVVWTDSRNETAGERIFLSKSLDGGESFEKSIMIYKSNGSLGQTDPEVDVAGNTVGVTWSDANSTKVYVSVSQDGGTTFTHPERPSNSTSLVPEWEPSIFVKESGYVAISWIDRRTSEYDIYFSESFDFGQTFGADVRVNDDATANYQYQPSVWVDENGYAYVVWMDFRSGTNWDVYFARSPSGLADLVTTSSDIIFLDGDSVPYGTQVTVNATVWNFGNANASDIRV